ncbi:Wnt inhibitory factor 1 [Blomia tropicalis]|nr:Wnt inhibitory factor 1 [Blomia tropicalis]
MAENKIFANELQNLINPEPIFEDPEDDVNFDSGNKWFNDTNEESNIVETPSISKIRKKQVSILSSINKRYIGKKVSRNELESDENEEDSFDVVERSENEDDDEQDFDEELDDNEEEDEDEDNDDDYNDSEIEEKSVSDGQEENIDNNEGDICLLNLDTDKQLLQANSIKNQLMFYDNLLETRIKMQKLLSSINRLPQGKDFHSAKDSKSIQLTELLNDCGRGLRKLGKSLLEIDNFIDCTEKVEDDDSEEVVSSAKKRKSINFSKESLNKRFCELGQIYRPIIDNWHQRTKYVNSNVKLRKFDSFEVCPTKAIDRILCDKERLLARTKIRRSMFNIIGQKETEDEQNSSNVDIYDDDDFYHQLLKQIIENKMSDVDDSSVITKKYIEIQRMRNKLKKQVDTRASKGRKIRYDVHEKLVNFMAPVNKTTMTEEGKDELFKSLFDQTIPIDLYMENKQTILLGPLFIVSIVASTCLFVVLGDNVYDGSTQGDVSLWIDETQVKQFFNGFPMKIFAISDGVVLQYLLDPNFEKYLPVIPSEVASVNFTWKSGHGHQYRYEFDKLQSFNEEVLYPPVISIDRIGQVPTKPTVFQVFIPCVGNTSGIALFTLGLKIIDMETDQHLSGTPINLKLQKQCSFRGPDPECDKKCGNGFLGKYCESALCYPQCMNGGTCIAPGKCACSDGFQGLHCEGGICSEKCLNGGKCIQKDKCSCRKGYYGTRCEYSKCEIPCLNGGKCIGVNRCRCKRGFRGNQCQIKITRTRCHKCTHNSKKKIRRKFV